MTCGACMHHRHDPREPMSALGFGGCRFLPVWCWVPAVRGACYFDPPRCE